MVHANGKFDNIGFLIFGSGFRMKKKLTWLVKMMMKTLYVLNFAITK